MFRVSVLHQRCDVGQLRRKPLYGAQMRSRGDRAERRMSGEYGIYETLRKRAGSGAPQGRGLGRLKNILAASTRQDWEAHGPRLWVHKGGDRQLRIVDLTDDERRVELHEEWARSAAGAGSVALLVELSICWGSELLAKVPALWVDSGRAFIPWPRQEEDGRLVVSRWQYDLCRVISAGEYLGTYPVRTYLRRAGIVVI